jgi:hypothetical protein
VAQKERRTKKEEVMPYDDDYVKQLERENELLRRKIEMNPTLAEILKKYFCLSKEVNRKGEETYGLVLTPMAQSHFLRKGDYDYLKDVGVHEDLIEGVNDFEKNVTVTNDDGINEILDELYKNIKLPKEYMTSLQDTCPVEKIDDYIEPLRQELGIWNCGVRTK